MIPHASCPSTATLSISPEKPNTCPYQGLSCRPAPLSDSLHRSVKCFTLSLCNFPSIPSPSSSPSLPAVGSEPPCARLTPPPSDNVPNRSFPCNRSSYRLVTRPLVSYHSSIVVYPLLARSPNHLSPRLNCPPQISRKRPAAVNRGANESKENGWRV